MATKTKQPLAKGYDQDVVKEERRRDGYEVVVFDGERWHYRFCGYGVLKARRAGYEPVKLITELWLKGALAQDRAGSLAALTEKDASEATSTIEAFVELMPHDRMMETFAVVFYAGVSSFYPELTVDAILRRITLTNMREIEPLVAREMLSVMRDRKGMQRNGEANADKDGGQEGNSPTPP